MSNSLKRKGNHRCPTLYEPRTIYAHSSRPQETLLNTAQSLKMYMSVLPYYI